MTLLVRKINKAKWCVESLGSPDQIKADAVTNCIRTKGDTLSFWAVEDESKLDEAVLAIAASNDSLDTFDVVVIPINVFQDNGFTIAETPGRTRCADLVGCHRDLAQLTLAHLNVLSTHISEHVFHSKSRRYRLSQLKELIKKAIADGRIDVADLPDNILAKVK